MQQEDPLPVVRARCRCSANDFLRNVPQTRTLVRDLSLASFDMGFGLYAVEFSAMLDGKGYIEAEILRMAFGGRNVRRDAEEIGFEGMGRVARRQIRPRLQSE